ncbi:MAG: DPP IV N-terminal domain-containing protein [Prevotella sp.]
MTVLCAYGQSRELTLEDLNFGGNNYYNMIPKNKSLIWWGDNLVRTDSVGCFIVDKNNGKEKLLFNNDDINKWASLEGQHKVSIYICSYYDRLKFPYSDKSLVMVANDEERMLVDFKKKSVVWRQKTKDEDNEEWNPSSKAVAFVKENNLYVTDAEGNITQVTTDGSREIVYAQSVHRDEFGIYKGTFWSPDGGKLAFYRMDQSMVKDYPLVNIDPRMATEEPEKYPMAGETSHKVTVGIYDLATGKTTYLNAGDPTDRYFTNIQWAPDSKHIYISELDRSQKNMQLTRYDAITGDLDAVLYKEHNDKYVHPVTAITFLPWDDNKFILQSEKDGYNHLYLFDTDGREIKQLTKGEWVVISLLGFNKKDKKAIFLSTENSPIQNNLYTVDIVTGKRTLLDNGCGMHANTYDRSGVCSKIISASGQYLFDNYSEPDVPRVIDIINTGNGKRFCYFKADDPWKEKDSPIFTSGTIKAADGKTDLFYRMVKPHDFDPQKKYPAIVYVYGGPGIRNVEARWHYASRGWESYMAQRGYVLFILDNRGSSDRGLEFEQATYLNLGQEEMKDQMRGVDFLKQQEYVDTTRMGIHGWSFGGFMTISLMTNYPEVFKVGVAGGPVIDWKWYEVMYGERYMSTPQLNPEGYEKTSLLKMAKNLKGKLQIIIGLNDPIVVPQHALSFIKECINVETQPDFFVYPGEGHNMQRRKSVHLHERITQYFEDYLKPLSLTK